MEVAPDKETVWLNRNQLAVLFDRDVKTIGKYINNALKEELDSSVVAKFATVQNEEMFQQMDEKGEVYSCIYKIPFTHFFFQLLHLL